MTTPTQLHLMFAHRLIVDGVLEVTDTGQIVRKQRPATGGGWQPAQPATIDPDQSVHFRYAGQIVTVDPADLVYTNTVGRPVPETDEIEHDNLDRRDNRPPNLKTKVKDPPPAEPGYRKIKRRPPTAA